MTWPSTSRRIAAAILGTEHQGDRLASVALQRGLPLGRRLLTSVLGVQTRSPVSTVVAPRTEPREHVSPWRGPTSWPRHLLSEDRWEYEAVLDDTLRLALYDPEFARFGRRLNLEQLRTMALNAAALITAAAATEYQHYVAVREARSHVPSSVHEHGSMNSGLRETKLAAARKIHESNGSGVGAVVAVLATVLAGAVAVLALLVGFPLKALGFASASADILLTIGWISGAVAGAVIVLGGTGLLITALRPRPPNESGRDDTWGREVARARVAWHEALQERGFLPFLREALADESGSSPDHAVRADTGSSEGPEEPDGRAGRSD